MMKKKEGMNELQPMNLFILCKGIEGAFSGTGSKTVIPRKVVGKFSIRLVPHQEPEEVKRLVNEHINNLHQQRGSPNRLRSVLNCPREGTATL